MADDRKIITVLDQRIDDYVALARGIIDPQAPVTWNASLWERDSCGAWTDLGR